MARKSQGNGVESEAFLEVLGDNPGLRDEALAAVDVKIEYYQELRSKIAGGATGKTGRKRRGAASGLKHKEAILKVLSQSEFKGGASSRQIREAASKFNHDFGKSLGTTLHLMYNESEVDAKPKKDSKREFLYVPGKNANKAATA